MKILKQGANGVQLLQDIAKLLEELRKLNTPQAILEALLAYEAKPAAAGPVATLVKKLNLDGKKIQKFIADNRPELTFLVGNVGAAAKQKLSWPVAADTSLDVNAVAVELAASASATVAGDDDGDLFGDGAVTYDKATEAFLTFEVEGKVSAGANVPPFPLGSITGKAAFSASAGILVGNYFKHAAADPALGALIDDVRAFTLPYDAAALRPGQYVRLQNTGSVAVSGELSFGKTIVATGEVTAKEIGLAATPLSAEVKFGASLGFEAEMSGNFNILVSRDATPGRVRVQLVRMRESSRGVSLKAGVGVTIKGIDKVASSLVSQITTPLAPLVKLLEDNLTKYGDLHKLFSEELGAQVGALVNSNKVVQQIEDWLKQIGSSVDLKAKLKEVLVNAVDAKAGPLVDQLQDKIKPLVKAVKDLIGRYQKALKTMNAAVKAAAEVKIGIELAHKRASFETRKTALDLSIDPTLPAYRKIVHGDFTEALAIAAASEPGVTLNDATWSGSGGVRIETSLNVSAFGRNAGVGTLLKQDWEWELTATGDLTLGVTSSIQAWSKSWRALRSVTFLADTRVLAVVSSANQLLSPDVADTANLEASIRWDPPATRKQLTEWEQGMVDLGVLAAQTAMTTELALSTSAKQPYGDIVASAVLNLSESQLETIATQPVDAASGQFVTQLTTFYLSNVPNPFAITDRNGQLFLQWPMVREWGATKGVGTPTFFKNLEFKSDDGKTSVQVAKEELPVVANAWRIVAAFERMLGQLGTLNANKLVGRSLEAAIASIRVQQRRLMDEVREIIAATPLRREELGKAFFVTLWQLAGGSLAIDPFVVVVRKGATPEKDERFVYA